MSINRIFLASALALLVHAPLAAAIQVAAEAAPEAATPQGFDALAAELLSAGASVTVPVVGGEPVRALAQNVKGRTADRPFVNVLRWVDARPFRSKIISIKQRAQLKKPAPDTQASLWVRVVRADGTTAYADHGLDQPTSSSEWTTLESIGAIADDATDLYFGLLVEGTTPVNIGEFSIEVRGSAGAHDVRLSVPNRWVSDPNVEMVRIKDAETLMGEVNELGASKDHPVGAKLDLRVTTFRPAGHERGELPTVCFLRCEAGLRRSFDQGRALLAAMRAAQDPAVNICFVEPVAMQHAPLDWLGIFPVALNLRLAAAIGSSVDEGRVHTIIGPGPLALGSMFKHQDDDPAGAHKRSRTYTHALSGARSLMAEPGELNLERVGLRWASAVHEAHALGDPTLIDLLFDASIESMEPWPDTPLVRQASHSMAGHSHTHVHADGTTHTHSY